MNNNRNYSIPIILLCGIAGVSGAITGVINFLNVYNAINLTYMDILAFDAAMSVPIILPLVAVGILKLNNKNNNHEWIDLENISTNIELESKIEFKSENLNKIRESFKHLTQASIVKLQDGLYLNNLPEKIEGVEILTTNNLNSIEKIGEKLSILYTFDELRNDLLGKIDFNKSYEKIGEEFVNAVCDHILILPNIKEVETNLIRYMSEQQGGEAINVNDAKIFMSIGSQNLLKYLGELDGDNSQKTTIDLTKIYENFYSEYCDSIFNKSSTSQELEAIDINAFIGDRLSHSNISTNTSSTSTINDSNIIKNDKSVNSANIPISLK